VAYEFAHHARQARITSDAAYAALTNPPNWRERCDPDRLYMLWYPIPPQDKRSFLEVDMRAPSWRARLGALGLILATVYRGHGRAYMHLCRTSTNAPLGYLWSLYTHAKRPAQVQPPPPPADAPAGGGGPGAPPPFPAAVAVPMDAQPADGGGALPGAPAGAQVAEEKGGGEDDDEDEAQFSNEVPIAEWVVAQCMSGKLGQAMELVHAPSAELEKRKPRKGMSVEQRRLWNMLEEFANLETLQEWSDMLLHRFDLLQGDSTEEKVECALERVFDPDVALRQYAIARMNTEGALSNLDQEDLVLQKRLELTGASLFGVHREGKDSFALTTEMAHPRVMLSHEMPHLARPIDVRSKEYLEEWQHVRGAEFGVKAPNEAFHRYFCDKIGTTCPKVDGDDLETVIRSTRTLIEKGRHDLGRDVDAFERVRDEFANKLTAAAASSRKVADGLRQVLEAMRSHAATGGSLTTYADRVNLIAPEGGGCALEYLLDFLCTMLDVGEGVVNSHQLGACLFMLLCSTARDNLDSIMNPQVTTEGPEGVGKTFLAMVIGRRAFRKCDEVGYQSRLADTGGDSARGPIEIKDEFDPGELSLEHAGTPKDTHAFIVSGNLVPSRHNTRGTRQATAEQNGSRHMHIDEQGNRNVVETNATKMKAVLYATNMGCGSIPRPLARRVYMLTVQAAEKAKDVPTARTRKAAPARLSRLYTQAAQCYGRTFMALSDLALIVNTMCSAGLMSVSHSASKMTYNIGAADIPRFVSNHPGEKFNIWFSYSATMLDALVCMQMGIKAQSPRRPLSPFVDMRNVRELLCATPGTTAFALDAILARANSQVYIPGMPLVCVRLRDLALAYDQSGHIPGRLVQALPKSLPYHQQYIVMRDFFAGTELDVVSKAGYLARKLTSGVGGGTIMTATAFSCICYLLVGPPCPEDAGVSGAGGARSKLPTVYFSARGPDLYMLQSFVDEAIADERRAFMARAFQPGTLELVVRRTIETDPKAPSVFPLEVMTREAYARYLNEFAAMRDRVGVHLARDKVLQRLDAAWDFIRVAVTKVGSAMQRDTFVDEFLQAHTGYTVERGPTPANLTTWFGNFMARITPRSASASAAADARAAERREEQERKQQADNFIQSLARMGNGGGAGDDENGLVLPGGGGGGGRIQGREQTQAEVLDAALANARFHSGIEKAINDYWRARAEVERKRTRSVRGIESTWAKEDMLNPRVANPVHIERAIRMRCIDPSVRTEVQSSVRTRLPVDLFRSESHEHLRNLGVPDDQIAWRWSELANRRMLVMLAGRRNLSLGSLFNAIDLLDPADPTHEKRSDVLYALCAFAHDAAVFFLWLRRMGGLDYEVTREEIDCMFSERGWDIDGCMKENAAKFLEKDGARELFSAATLRVDFVDIVTAVCRIYLYDRSHAPVHGAAPGADEDALPPPLEDGVVNGDGEVRPPMRLAREGTIEDLGLGERIREALPILPSRVEPEACIRGDLYAMLLATSRYDLFRELSPRLADGTFYEPDAPECGNAEVQALLDAKRAERRAALNALCTKRIWAQFQARKFVIRCITESVAPMWNIQVSEDEADRAWKGEFEQWLRVHNDGHMLRKTILHHTLGELTMGCNFTGANKMHEAWTEREPLLSLAPHPFGYPPEAEREFALLVCDYADRAAFESTEVSPAVDWKLVRDINGRTLYGDTPVRFAADDEDAVHDVHAMFAPSEILSEAAMLATEVHDGPYGEAGMRARRRNRARGNGGGDEEQDDGEEEGGEGTTVQRRRRKRSQSSNNGREQQRQRVSTADALDEGDAQPPARQPRTGQRVRFADQQGEASPPREDARHHEPATGEEQFMELSRSIQEL
jgi:hypothetical protein